MQVFFHAPLHAHGTSSLCFYIFFLLSHRPPGTLGFCQWWLPELRGPEWVRWGGPGELAVLADVGAKASPGGLTPGCPPFSLRQSLQLLCFHIPSHPTPRSCTGGAVPGEEPGPCCCPAGDKCPPGKHRLSDSECPFLDAHLPPGAENSGSGGHWLVGRADSQPWGNEPPHPHPTPSRDHICPAWGLELGAV